VKAPQVLCLHLNRLTIHPMTGELVKNNTPVAIPEFLDLKKYQHFPTTEVFRLISVVVHLGLSHDRGHYVVYRSLPFLDKTGESASGSRPATEASPRSNSERILFRGRRPTRTAEAGDALDLDGEPFAEATSASMLLPGESLDLADSGTDVPPHHLSRSMSSIGLGVSGSLLSPSSSHLRRSVTTAVSQDSLLKAVTPAKEEPTTQVPAKTGRTPPASLSRPLENRFWVRISDSDVAFATADEVLNCVGYLVFYEKVSL